MVYSAGFFFVKSLEIFCDDTRQAEDLLGRSRKMCRISHGSYSRKIQKKLKNFLEIRQNSQYCCSQNLPRLKIVCNVSHLKCVKMRYYHQINSINNVSSL